MAKVAVADYTISEADGSARVVDGFASEHEYVPHALRQALQSLGVEIDAFDRFETGDVDRKALKKAYERFAGPSRDLDPERFAEAEES